jgi:hypothetical protein
VEAVGERAVVLEAVGQRGVARAHLGVGGEEEEVRGGGRAVADAATGGVGDGLTASSCSAGSRVSAPRWREDELGGGAEMRRATWERSSGGGGRDGGADLRWEAERGGRPGGRKRDLKGRVSTGRILYMLGS